MSAYKGRLMLLKIGDGGSPEEIFTTIGGMRATRMHINRQLVPVADVTSAGWRRAVPESGMTALRIEGSGVFMGQSAAALLQEQALTGKAARYRLFFGDGAVVTALFIVAGYERSGRQGEPEGFTVTLENAGDVEYVAG